MRSRAEWALRAAAVAALALLLWGTLRPSEKGADVLVVRGALGHGLENATRHPVTAVAVELDSTPGAVHRDWLAAVRATGTDVAWRGSFQPIVIGAASVPEPEARVRVVVAAQDSARIVLSDGLGTIDTIAGSGGGSSRLLRTATGLLSASAANSRGTAALPTASRVRRVLVLGAAGWETKFVVAALEEAGWTVDARIRVAPGIETTQGGALPLDTARYSAVIALDGSAGSMATAIERYVGAGGGAILAGSSTRLPAFARIVPASAGRRRTAEPRAGLVLAGLRRDAVVLESQGGVAMVAARRVGFGRAVASGYDETWRWRMRRAADGASAHREWWTAVVSAVAYVPAHPARDSSATADPAPVAALVAALGPQSDNDMMKPTASVVWVPPTWLLFGVLLFSLLGEVVSRRLRGLS